MNGGRPPASPPLHLSPVVPEPDRGSIGCTAYWPSVRATRMPVFDAWVTAGLESR